MFQLVVSFSFAFFLVGATYIAWRTLFKSRVQVRNQDLALSSFVRSKRSIVPPTAGVLGLLIPALAVFILTMDSKAEYFPFFDGGHSQAYLAISVLCVVVYIVFGIGGRHDY